MINKKILEEIIELRETTNKSYSEIQELINKKHKEKLTFEQVKGNYIRSKNKEHADTEYFVKNLKDTHNTKKRNSLTNKENRLLVEYITAKDDLLSELKKSFESLKLKPIKVKRQKKDKSKKNMTLELLISDVHFGKKTDEFDLKVCQDRLDQIVEVIVNEVSKNSKSYNVETLIIALLGDIIESATMHGMESTKGVEFGNSKQIQVSIENLFNRLILPISKIGIDIVIPCVTGNHDRTELDRTMVLPGLDNVTWIIYNALKLLAEAHKLKHVKFIIPEKSFIIMPIYNNHVLYEHGDNRTIKSPNLGNLENFMNKRASQTSKVLDFFRLGHFHYPTIFGQGRIIINGALVGSDSYAEILGFSTPAVQILNFYIENDERPSCFYKSFPIYLK